MTDTTPSDRDDAPPRDRGAADGGAAAAAARDFRRWMNRRWPRRDSPPADA